MYLYHRREERDVVVWLLLRELCVSPKVPETAVNILFPHRRSSRRRHRRGQILYKYGSVHVHSASCCVSRVVNFLFPCVITRAGLACKVSLIHLFNHYLYVLKTNVVVMYLPVHYFNRSTI